MTRCFDAVIVGGGIVGVACARSLAREGLRVALVEPGEIGGAATASAMGHIVVLDDSPAQLALTRYSQSLWRQIIGELSPNVEYTQPGTLWVAGDEEELTGICRKHSVYQAAAIPSELLDPESLERLEPALRRGLAGALRMPEDAVVAPQQAAAFLLQQANATLLRYRTVSMGCGKVLLSNADELQAAILINAAGEGAPALTPGLPVAMRKGHLAITRPYPGLLRHQLVEMGYLKSAHVTTTDTVAFNVQPRRNGQVLIGSSRQFGAQSREVEPNILSRMFARAAEYIPGLPSLSIERTWTGFRAATPDKLPLIGPSANDPSLYLATGHEGLGITTSLATAQLLADLIAGRPTAIPIKPYLPTRNLARNWPAGEEKG